ncbi:MFS transporter [Limosilactobacillus caecicola]|uniref:MFS transporter n=1 Tax=Limosilactobacillus caecicola TaxID=2941332 RepID=UPI00203D96AA|nr:MFS transporter [Limosilactobacillus caecicola]
MQNKNSMITKLAFLSVSFMLTSAYAVQSALPQLKASLHVTQTQSEYLATTPSFAVMIFVILSPLLQQWFKISDKKMIMIGVTIVGVMGLVPFFNIRSYPIILASRLLLGAGYGLYNSQAISMISVWYEGSTRAQMLGWRAAAEQIGQAFTLFVAGLLLTASGWHASFLVYALAFVVLIFFGLRVPDDSKADKSASDQAEEATEDLPAEDEIQKTSPTVYLLVLFAFLLVVDYVGMENRFPGLAVNIRGAQYTGASNFLSLMLIGATLGGLFYGSIQKRLGFGTVYLGLGLMALSNFLFYFAGSNFVLLVIGLLLIGFPLQLVSPLIFNLLPGLAPAKRQPMVTSLVLIGFNFGAFFSPSIAEWTNHLMGQPTSGYGLAAPFLVYGIGLLVIAVIIFVATRRHATK